jgi:hypothetical protein
MRSVKHYQAVPNAWRCLLLHRTSTLTSCTGPDSTVRPITRHNERSVQLAPPATNRHTEYCGKLVLLYVAVEQASRHDRAPCSRSLRLLHAFTRRTHCGLLTDFLHSTLRAAIIYKTDDCSTCKKLGMLIHESGSSAQTFHFFLTF